MRHLNTRRGFLLTALATLIGFAIPTGTRAAGSGPLEEIPVTAHMQLTERDGKVIRVKSDLYRLEVVDPRICHALIITPREISLIAMRAGSTDITFWAEDETVRPTKIRVKVVAKKKEK